VKRAIDLFLSIVCFTGLRSYCRLLTGLFALGFILSPAPQSELRIRICADADDAEGWLYISDFVVLLFTLQ
jgi:hypothetical protein